MEKVLIAYFSHEGEAYVGGKIVPLSVGNTRVVAEMIGELTGAEAFRIEPVRPYPYEYRETVELARRELREEARPAIRGALLETDGCGAVMLGYPNWWGTIPRIVAAFLESRDFSGKTILPFCTHEGSGMGKSEEEIKKLCPRAEVR